MRIRTSTAFVAGLILWAIFGLLAQCLSAQTWTLPRGTVVKDNGQRTYRFTVDYTTASVKGEILRRQRLTGDYARGLAGGDVVWKNVAQAEFAPSEITLRNYSDESRGTPRIAHAQCSTEAQMLRLGLVNFRGTPACRPLVRANSPGRRACP